MGGFRSLKDAYPELASEWHPTKNGNLTPDQVTAGSGKVVWWKRSYDAPETGRHYDFEWRASVEKRALRGQGCPYLSGRAVLPGYNDLATTNPELALEWHPTKNGNLTPEQVTAGSNKIVWWKRSYDAPETGRHYDFEWKARIADRALKGKGCPYLSGKAVCPGYNDLATTNPELALEWHPTKNGSLTPEQVTAGSNKIVWWKRSYDAPETGRHYDFEWRASVKNRALNGMGCPYLSGKAVCPGYNDLATTNPELASEWHPTKNGSLTPEQVAAGSNKIVWWKRSYDAPETGRHYDFEWRASVEKRALRGQGCPYLSGKAVCPGYNDLATTNPELASEWHPTKNGSLTPEQVTAGSHKVVWWKRSYDAPETGRHYDFEWRTSVKNRALNGMGCPYLSGKAVCPGYNDLATTNPELASEWHPTKNGSLTPEQVTAGSNKIVWWKRSYDAPETGRHYDFEWRASVINRALKGIGCPYLSGRAVLPGYNDLATTNPELASEWHPTKNGSLTPEQVTAGSHKVVWWKRSYDAPETGRHYDFEWRAQIESRVLGGSGCPYLSGKAVLPGYNDLATTNPELALEWHPTKNGSLTPEQVTAGSGKVVWWKRSYDAPETGRHYDFEWKARIVGRALKGQGCPYLSGKAVLPGYNDLATKEPEIASELYDAKNHGVKAENIIAYSVRKYWWKCSKCGHIWRAAVAKRVSRGSGCPHCLRNRKHY